ncbi:MAG: DNA polymerase III subunit delta [Bdellovibrionales bacterium]|nr:DNA polymerase III subunit delta [Bdellovibrionales bacterium]
MAVWDFRQLQQNLETQTFPSVALIFGDEGFLINEALKLVRKHVIEPATMDFNYDSFFADADNVSKVRDTLETLPMMAARRLVVYRDIEKLKEKDWEQLYSLIEDPLDSCCFVLVAAKIDKRKRYFKSCLKKGQIIELKKPYDNQIPAWIDYIAYNHELKLNTGSIQILQQLVGNQLADLNSEIAKLKQFLGNKKTVDEQDVLQVVSRVRINSVFDLTEAIGAKDRAGALTFLANLLDHGQSELAAIALILRHLRIIASLKEGLKLGLRGAKLCSKVGVPSFFLQNYLQQCEKWNPQQISHAVKVLHETDKAIKSSPVSSHIWLENFILKTCQ